MLEWNGLTWLNLNFVRKMYGLIEPTPHCRSIRSNRTNFGRFTCLGRHIFPDKIPAKVHYYIMYDLIRTKILPHSNHRDELGSTKVIACCESKNLTMVGKYSFASEFFHREKSLLDKCIYIYTLFHINSINNHKETLTLRPQLDFLPVLHFLFDLLFGLLDK